MPIPPPPPPLSSSPHLEPWLFLNFKFGVLALTSLEVVPAFEGSFQERVDHRTVWGEWEQLLRELAPADRPAALRRLECAVSKIEALPNPARRSWFNSNRKTVECDWLDPVVMALCLATAGQGSSTVNLSWRPVLVDHLQKRSSEDRAAVVLRGPAGDETVVSAAAAVLPSVMIMYHRDWLSKSGAFDDPMTMADAFLENVFEQRFERSVNRLNASQVPLDLSVPFWSSAPNQCLEVMLLDVLCQKGQEPHMDAMWHFAKQGRPSAGIVDVVRLTAAKDSDNHIWFEHLLRQIQANAWDQSMEKATSPARAPRF